MEACAAELEVTASELESSPAFVAERDGGLLAYYLLRTGKEDPDAIELESLFVEPDAIGEGIGEVLLEHARREASRAGYRWLLIASDPHAVGFYRAAGAQRIGARPSLSFPGRELPLLRLDSTLGSR